MEVFAEVAEQTGLADELGCAIAWFAEHHFSNYCLCITIDDGRPLRMASKVLHTGDPVPWRLVVVFWTAEGRDPNERTAATLVTRHLSRPGEAVLSVGYSEPSLVLFGTAARLATAAPGDRQLAGAGMALVSDREDAAFRKSLARRGAG